MHNVIVLIVAVGLVWAFGKWRTNRHVVRGSRTNAYGLMSDARFPMSPKWGFKKKSL